MDRNLIFVDTEFSSLDPYQGEILSVGLVKESGEDLYLELEYVGDYDEWVKDNLVNHLNQPKVSREEARWKIKEFIGESEPYLMAYVNQFDVIYLHKLMGGVKKSPFFWLPLDFASILYEKGYDPEEYYKNQKEFCTKLGINAAKYHQHNALDDAKLLKEAYSKLMNK